MVKKKGAKKVSKKKKSSKKSDDKLMEQGEDGKNELPVKKMTKEMKALEKLEKEVTKFRSCHSLFFQFLSRAEVWMEEKHSQLLTILTYLDMDDRKKIGYVDFKAAMFDCGSLFNPLEAHLLCRILNPSNDGDIPYLEMKVHLARQREILSADICMSKIDLNEKKEIHEDQDSPENYSVDLLLQANSNIKATEPCKTCGLRIANFFPSVNIRYVKLLLRNVTFEWDNHHPTFLSKIVRTDMLIKALIELIQDITDTFSFSIVVYKDSSRSKESSLLPHRPLQDYVIKGHPLPSKAPEYQLYWDYQIDFPRCPILQYDHYFVGH